MQMHNLIHLEGNDAKWHQKCIRDLVSLIDIKNYNNKEHETKIESAAICKKHYMISESETAIFN